MPSDSFDHRRPTTTKPHHITTSTPPPEPEHLPCPRCDSTNTKFCYYNNYNFSQPRHFCKACRRYWTHGGTLRDIPIGGGSRKNAKRSRLTATTSHSHNNSSFEFRHIAPPAPTPILFPGVSMGDSFTSLLNGSHGLFGVEDGGFGFGRGVGGWPFSSGIGDGGGNMWQVEGGDGGEGLSLPELAISTPGMI